MSLARRPPVEVSVHRWAAGWAAAGNWRPDHVANVSPNWHWDANVNLPPVNLFAICVIKLVHIWVHDSRHWTAGALPTNLVSSFPFRLPPVPTPLHQCLVLCSSTLFRWSSGIWSKCCPFNRWIPWRALQHPTCTPSHFERRPPSIYCGFGISSVCVQWGPLVRWRSLQCPCWPQFCFLLVSATFSIRNSPSFRYLICYLSLFCVLIGRLT